MDVGEPDVACPEVAIPLQITGLKPTSIMSCVKDIITFCERNGVFFDQFQQKAPSEWPEGAFI